MAGLEVSASRVEAISDGVIAVLITIMVLELRTPADPSPAALIALWPQFAIYFVSFLFIATYWVNHRFLFGHLQRVDDRVLWTNMALLFLMSLIPFSTAYVGQNGLAAFPTAVYAAVMLVAGLGYNALAVSIRAQYREAPPPALQRRAMLMNAAALSIYALAIPAAWISPPMSLALIFAPCLLFVTRLARPS